MVFQVRVNGEWDGGWQSTDSTWWLAAQRAGDLPLGPLSCRIDLMYCVAMRHGGL